MPITEAVILDTVRDLGGPGRVGPLETDRLADGGFAILSDAPEGVQIDLHNVNGDRTTNIFGAVDGSCGQIGAGDLVVSNKIADRLQFSSIDLNGDGATIGFVNSQFVSQNGDLATGPNAFAAVSEIRISDTDRDIAIEIYGLDALGDTATLLDTFSADTSGAFDSDPKLAILTGGAVAVVWTRTTDPGLSTETSDVMYAVYGPAGGVVLGPTVLEGDNDVNRKPSIAAKPDGGFAVAWESRTFSFASVDIRLAQFDASGAPTGETLVSNRDLPTTGTDDGFDDADPFVTVGPDGNIVVSYTRAGDGGTDVGVVLVRGTNVIAETTFTTPEAQSDSAVVTFGTGQIAVFSRSGTGIAGRQYAGDRDAAGDSGGGTVSNDTIIGDDFTDLLNGLGGNDVLRGRRNDDALLGGDGQDQLFGDEGADELDGEDGNDTLNGGAGNDAMAGGSGNDTYFVDVGGDTTVELANGGTDTVIATVNRTLAANVEILRLAGTAALNGVGNGLANTLVGNGANNLLRGLDGNDLLSGAAGDDTLDGGAGKDTLNGGAGLDRMSGGTGDDSYFVDAGGDQTLETTAGAAGGIDTVFSTVSRTLGDNLENLRLQGAENLNGKGNALGNTITGNAGNNTLTGLDGVDALDGGGGNDTLNGGTGADTMTGGAGDDRYFVDAGGDQTIEASGGGVDTVVSSVNRTIGANLENLTLQGTAAAGNGNALDNVLTGANAANVLKGLAGADTLVGLGGTDTLFGGDGRDTLDGGTGADRLSGGADVDFFVFDTSSGGNDIITDFSVSQDFFILTGAFTQFSARIEGDNGDTRLLVDAGGINTIFVENVTGLSLEQWNDLIF